MVCPAFSPLLITILTVSSNINNFDVKNFVHSDYWDTLSESSVDGRILESSLKFRDHIKKLLLNQQKEFLKLARKNSKR